MNSMPMALSGVQMEQSVSQVLHVLQSAFLVALIFLIRKKSAAATIAMVMMISITSSYKNSEPIWNTRKDITHATPK